MPTVLLGNVNPSDPSVEGKKVTTFIVPDDRSNREAAAEILDAWNMTHSEDPPEWVAADDERLANAVADNWTDVAIGMPDDGWGE